MLNVSVRETDKSKKGFKNVKITGENMNGDIICRGKVKELTIEEDTSYNQILLKCESIPKK